MVESFWNYGLLLITALCWGVTNVLIKRGSTGVNAVKADNRISQIALEIKYLFTNWKVNKRAAVLFIC